MCLSNSTPINTDISAGYETIHPQACTYESNDRAVDDVDCRYVCVYIYFKGYTHGNDTRSSNTFAGDGISLVCRCGLMIKSSQLKNAQTHSLVLCRSITNSAAREKTPFG